MRKRAALDLATHGWTDVSVQAPHILQVIITSDRAAPHCLHDSGRCDQSVQIGLHSAMGLQRAPLDSSLAL